MPAQINNGIVPILTADVVIARPTDNGIVPFSALDDIIAPIIEDDIVAPGGFDGVIAGARTDEIVAFPGLDDVVSTQAGDDILAGRPYQDIIAKSTDGGGRHAQARDGTCLGGGGTQGDTSQEGHAQTERNQELSHDPPPLGVKSVTPLSSPSRFANGGGE